MRQTFRTAALIAMALVSTTSPSWALQVTDGPTLTMNPNGVTPLAGRIDLTADTPVRVTLKVGDGIESWAIQFPDYQLQHSVPLLGLKAADVYTIEVTVTDRDGRRTVLPQTLSATTDPLPADFPLVSVFYKNPAKMEPGFTLMDKMRRAGSTGAAYTMIVDNNGQVRWYSTVGGQDGMRQLPNGRLLLLDSSEMDLLGNTFQPRALAVPGLFLHHDLFPTDYGNFLSLTLEKVVVPNYPTSETDPNAPTKDTEITSDAVVEFLPDGSLYNQWHLTDMLDPHRIGYDSTRVGFPLFDSPDWSHSNAVLYDASDDSIIVSIRHQDAVVKFSRSTGQLIWILGNHANWGPQFQPYLLNPVGTPFEWQFHQHAPMLTPQGTLLLFDNGNYRAAPFDGTPRLTGPQSYSRGVEYAIDPVKMEVRQVWQYGSDLAWPHFSASQGKAEWMPHTGNVLLTMSDTEYMAGVPTASWGFGYAHTAILEVTHDTPAEKVLDLRIYDPNPDSRVWIYRSDKIPTLYASNVRMFFDSDQDGVLDNLDNCTFVANVDQRDTDQDGFGNICDPDLNNDGVVDYNDGLIFVQRFQSSDADADFDGDGVVTWPDLQILIDRYFTAPGPSGIGPVVAPPPS
jgi:arylsulfate sulfotransferase